MCHLLTIGVRGALPPELRRRRLHLALHENPDSGHRYPSDVTAYAVTSRGCSCGLVRTTADDAAKDADDAALRRRYERKGWSQSKIERALADARRTESRGPLFREDLASFLKTLGETLGELQLILHWHSGEFETEKFQLRGNRELTAAELSDLSALEEDVRYVVRWNAGD